ncbi:hypothetical protein VNI00_012344 [Paramarasmius palmivorus]|uniref:DUF6534 domain-containing protein n=1 Tax=Paramarasmius palmivorus TaxID=297713 RepID=A0AAW0C7A5_9AGAR
MGQFDDPFGSILISTWICSALEMLIIKDTIYYYNNYTKDRLFLKAFIGITVFVDFLSLLSDYADVYLLTVKNWGNPVVLRTQYWPVTSYLATTGITALLVQSFLTYRFWSLTKSWSICLILSLGILVSFGGSIATATVFAIFPSYEERVRGLVPVIIWMVTTTVTDIAITSVLIWRLYKMKTTFKHTESLVYRVIRTSVQTGATTCIIATITLITFLVNTSSNVETAFAFILGRTYVLTLLFNVNLRMSNRDAKESEPDSHTGHRGPAVTLEGIQVHRTAVVHMDESDYAINERLAAGKQQNSDAISAKTEFDSDRDSDVKRNASFA